MVSRRNTPTAEVRCVATAISSSTSCLQDVEDADVHERLDDVEHHEMSERDVAQEQRHDRERDDEPGELGAVCEPFEVGAARPFACSAADGCGFAALRSACSAPRPRRHMSSVSTALCPTGKAIGRNSSSTSGDVEASIASSSAAAVASLVQLTRGCIVDPRQPPGRQPRRENGAGEDGDEKEVGDRNRRRSRTGLRAAASIFRNPSTTAGGSEQQQHQHQSHEDAPPSSPATSGRNSTVTVPSAPVHSDGRAAGRRQL